ncbi:MAG: cytochrome c oxidase subunit II [Deltaproteobacteria bacterium]|nr:cytochrome c oxidase subunit II [Deltaproteobacteria bacterium]
MFGGLLPENVSSFGGDIDSVFRLILYVVGFFFIVAEILLVYFAVHYRRSRSRHAVYSRGEKAREAAWVLVPAAIVLMFDLGIDAAGHRAWALVKQNPPRGEVEVLVTAKQFNWNFTYPDKSGKLDSSNSVTLENELHVPAGKVVRIVLTSEDVIHSFWVPNFRLKQDVVPGRKIVAWFKVARPGTYEIACSELCGFGHYSMRGEVIVHTEAEYARWRAEKSVGGGATR